MCVECRWECRSLSRVTARVRGTALLSCRWHLIILDTCQSREALDRSRRGRTSCTQRCSRRQNDTRSRLACDFVGSRSPPTCSGILPSRLPFKPKVCDPLRGVQGAKRWTFRCLITESGGWRAVGSPTRTFFAVQRTDGRVVRC